jgi:hypothetical protein
MLTGWRNPKLRPEGQVLFIKDWLVGRGSRVVTQFVVPWLLFACLDLHWGSLPGWATLSFDCPDFSCDKIVFGSFSPSLQIFVNNYL